MKFIDLFAGIGGIHTGLTKAGMKCVGWCEQDKYAQASYRALYPTDNLWFSPDVRALNGTEMPYADLWCCGFPYFTAGTLVKTSQGLTPIEEINNGDLVLTKELRYKPVIQTMRREVSEVYNIKACGTEGFTDSQFDTCAKIQSNAQLYKQAGNSVSIPIVYELGKKIIEHHRREHGDIY